MTPEQLDALRGHTPGPWRHNVGVIYGSVTGKLPIASIRSVQSQADLDAIEANFNGALIAAAPSLLSHIDEQQREIDRLLDVIRKVQADRDRFFSERTTIYQSFLHLREVLQLLYDTSDATPGTAQWEDYELAIHRAEQALKGVEG